MMNNERMLSLVGFLGLGLLLFGFALFLNSFESFGTFFILIGFAATPTPLVYLWVLSGLEEEK